MQAQQYAAIAVALALTACNPFHHEQAVQIERGEVNATQRWNATLVTPSQLTGAVQVRGTAWMAPSSDNDTRVHISISNAAPGGVHPWQLHRGKCGTDQGTVGSADAYKALRVDNDGKASAETIVDTALPTSGDFFVAVYASPDNLATTIACGNLAPPVQ